MATLERYTAEQVDILLDLYFRDHVRPAPFPAIAKAIGVRDADGLDDLLWKVITGYDGRDPVGPRRHYVPTSGRCWRAGFVWRPREDAAIKAALVGEGRRRNPPVDVAYVAAVLARPVMEVVERWTRIRDPLRRAGFGLGGQL